jgi:hypothetical protein
MQAGSGVASARSAAGAEGGWRVQFVLVAVVAGLYTLLFNRDFTVDGLAYATAVESGHPLFHSNHLLFNAIHHGLWRALDGFGPQRAIWWIQGVNAATGVLTVTAMSIYLSRRAGAIRAALLAGLLAGSFAFWSFAQEPEVYLPPLGCVAVSLALLRDPRCAPGWAQVAMVSMLAVFAILLLQQYVLWYPSLLMLLADRLGTDAARRQKLAFVAIAVPLVCLAVYLGIGFALERVRDLDGLLHWLLGYGWSQDAGVTTYRTPPPLPARVAGLGLALGNLVFAYEVAQTPLRMLAATITGLGLVALLLAGWRAAWHARAADAGALVLFLVLNLAFAFWWEARNIEFLLPVAFAGMTLAGYGASRLQPALLATVLLVVVAINAFSAFWPQRTTPERYQEVLALHRQVELRASDAVIAEELNTTRWLAYFHGIDTTFLPGAVSAAMHGDQALADARRELLDALAEGRRVFTLERAQRGRLRALAERFAVLGRAGYAGEVETDLDRLYDGLVLEPVQGLPSAQRVLAPMSPVESRHPR